MSLERGGELSRGAVQSCDISVCEAVVPLPLHTATTST